MGAVGRAVGLDGMRILGSALRSAFDRKAFTFPPTGRVPRGARPVSFSSHDLVPQRCRPKNAPRNPREDPVHFVAGARRHRPRPMVRRRRPPFPMTSPHPSEPIYGRAFWGWSAVLLLVKGLVILALADVFFYGEELAKGSVAKAMIDGLPVPFHTLIYHYYEGGGFVISMGKALLFLLVGENMLAHRLLGLLTCWAVFWAFWRLVRHHFGPRAAHWAAAIFVFGPSGFQRYSLLTLGIHFEAMLFGLLLLDEGLRLLREREWQPTRLRCAAVGAIAGFGIFFSYQIGLILGWVGLWVLALRWRWLFSQAGLWLLLGFLVGLSPLLVMAGLVGPALLDVHGTALGRVDSNWEKLQTFLHTLFVADPWPNVVLHALYACAALAALVVAWIMARGQRWVWAYLSGFVALWMLAWYAGPFMEPRPVTFFAWLRWAPMTLVVMIVGAWGWARLVDAGRPGAWWARWIGIGLIGVGAVQAGQIIERGRLSELPNNWALLRALKGYNYLGHFGTLMQHQKDRSPASLRPILAYDEPDPELLYGDFAMTATTLAHSKGEPRSVEQWLTYFEEVDPERAALFLRGMGPAWVQPRGGSIEAALRAVQTSATAVPTTVWEEAIGYFGTGWSYRPQDILRDVESLPQELRTPAFLRGVGARFFRFAVVYPYGGRFVMHPARAERFLQDFPQGTQDSLRAGWEQERTLWTLRRP